MPATDNALRPAADAAISESIVDRISSWLAVPADEVDRALEPDRTGIVAAIHELNERAAADPDAFYAQQVLLSRLYELSMRVPEGLSAEGSVILHEVTRLLERATTTAEDSRIAGDTYENMPQDPRTFPSWLKDIARKHPVYKHPYYVDFIRHHADADDLRTYVIQESLVDSRFDDLLALMQVGSGGAAKMEIAANYWDEMGHGDPEMVHTGLFKKIYEVFDIGEDVTGSMTANDLLAGNLAVLLCRYRRLFPEAVGFLGMTEWLVPDRFTNVVHAWERLGLPDVGITYHRIHVVIDARHAAGWFRNVMAPSATSAAMRRGITRGALWRLNSSARHLDERLRRATASGGGPR